MDYEFHVGDYVETNDGRVGYVDFCSNGSYSIYLKTIEKNGYSYSSRMLLMPEITDEELTENFVRIGQYDFTKYDFTKYDFTRIDEGKIEPLTEEYTKSLEYTKSFPICKTTTTGNDSEWRSIDIGAMSKKINELVDAVNSIKKELNNG